MSNKNVGEAFSGVFKESILETIQSIVGENPAKALLFHLKFPESADEPAEFARNLRAVLLAGSPMIEAAIMKQLWNNIGMFSVHTNEPGSFEQRVGRARELYAERQKHLQVVAR